VIVTKLDGDTRGGATLSISYITKLPIKYIGGRGRHRRFSWVLPETDGWPNSGNGWHRHFIRKSNRKPGPKNHGKNHASHVIGQFDLEDLRNQLRQMSKMGNVSGLIKMMPGLAGKISDQKLDEAQQKLWVAEILMSSMTLKERREPVY
jgi:signal recognition particle subunit SRP54